MKKMIKSLLVLSMLIAVAQAQTASNFQKTDDDGTYHDLYKYLDEGKYVALEFGKTAG